MSPGNCDKKMNEFVTMSESRSVPAHGISNSIEDCSSSDCSSYSGSNNEYDDLILTSEQEEQLEEAGIDTFDFECMDDDEKMEALEEAGLDPFDFDMY